MKSKLLRPLGMASVLTLGQICTAISAFLINLLSASVLLPGERGGVALLLQLTYLGAVVAVLGVERPFLANIQSDFGTALGWFVRLARPGNAVAAAPLLAASVAIAVGDLELGLVLAAMSLYIIFNCLGKGVRVAAIASSKARYFLYYVAGSQGGMLVLSIVLASIGTSSSTVWYLAYVASGGTGLAIYLYARRRGPAPSMKAEDVGQIRRQGLRLLPASFGNTAMLRSDRLILPALAGSAALGIYVVVATVMEMATWPISQWVDTSLRRWTNDRQTLAFTRGFVFRQVLLGALMGFGLAVLLGLIALAAITVLFPPSYSASLDLIIPLGVASVVYSVCRVQQGLLISSGRTGWVSTAEIAGMAFSVVGYLVFIPVWGALGAAVGSIVGYFATMCFGTWCLMRLTRSALLGVPQPVDSSQT